MISERELQLILECALQGRGDFAEVFLENTEESQMNSNGSEITGIRNIQIFGAGIYILSGTDSIYVYSNEVTFPSLMKLADTAARLLEAGQSKENGSTGKNRTVNLQRQGLNCFTSAANFPVTSYSKKEKLLRNAVMEGKNAGPQVQSLHMGYFDSDQRIRIANSEGLLTEDRRQTARLRCQAVVGDGIDNVSRWEDVFLAGGFDAFAASGIYAEAVRSQICRMDLARKGKMIQRCNVPVLLEAGTGAVFFHECCGHMLEGCAVVSKESPYSDMVGQRVASEKLTLVDDGTIRGQVATARIDDEGHLRQKNVLIENGILKGFLNDRLCGRILGTGSTGSGRRQNYTFAPTCRMSNTFVLPGTDDHDEILKSMDRGVYVTGIGGGNGGAQFTIMVEDAFWVERGELAYPLKPFTITGNGISMMKKIDRVGNRLGDYDGAFCGAASGLVPTTTNQPRIRISQLSIG
ncbi:MAG: TldD/PmbA family protein [Anaerovoracaceae bacterium]